MRSSVDVPTVHVQIVHAMLAANLYVFGTYACHRHDGMYSQLSMQILDYANLHIQFVNGKFEDEQGVL